MNASELKAMTGLDSWHFQYDNPTILGWTVVAFYGIAALSCAIAAIPLSSRKSPGSERGPGGAGIWWLLAFVLAFLGVNKQLNLQTLMIVILRRLSFAGGWWEQRRAAQLFFSVVFGLGIGLLLSWLALRHRDFFRENRQVFWGVVILAVFVALRAATINHADAFLRIHLGDKRWAWILEISGSVLIGIGAVRQTAGKCPK